MEAETIKLTNTLPQKAVEYETAIAELKTKYGELTLTDLNDKQQYEIIKKARTEVKTVRVGVSKYCKQERDVANAYIKANTTKEKEILAMLEPLEDKLTAEEEKYEAEQQRLKDVEIEKQRQIFLGRKLNLKSLGAIQDDEVLKLGNVSVNMEHLALYDSEQYEVCYGKFEQESLRIEQEKAELERLKQEEAARIEKVKAEQLAEAQRLDAQRKEQEAKQAAIDAENKRIADEQAAREKAIRDEAAKLEAEKQRIVDEERKRIEAERRAKELEDAKNQAAEQALKDVEAKRVAEQKAKEEAERKFAEQERKRIERMPDKTKLKDFALGLAIDLPELKSDEAKAILDEAVLRITAVRQYIEQQSKNL